MSAGEDSSPQVRELRPSDWGVVRAVARAGWAYAYEGVIPERTRREFLEGAYSDATLRRRMENGVFLVAVVGGEAVGFADFFFSTDPGVEVELGAIYVLPELHGRGIGGRLLEEGLARFRRVERCVIWVVRENYEARGFYEACGFRAVGEGAWSLPGLELVELQMALELPG